MLQRHDIVVTISLLFMWVPLYSVHHESLELFETLGTCCNNCQFMRSGAHFTSLTRGKARIFGGGGGAKCISGCTSCAKQFGPDTMSTDVTFKLIELMTKEHTHLTLVRSFLCDPFQLQRLLLKLEYIPHATTSKSTVEHVEHAHIICIHMVGTGSDITKR